MSSRKRCMNKMKIRTNKQKIKKDLIQILEQKNTITTTKKIITGV